MPFGYGDDLSKLGAVLCTFDHLLPYVPRMLDAIRTEMPKQAISENELYDQYVRPALGFFCSERSSTEELAGQCQRIVIEIRSRLGTHYGDASGLWAVLDECIQ